MNGDSILTTRQIALHAKGILPPVTAVLHLQIEENIGGNLYRQIYRVRPLNQEAAFVGLIPNAVYCLKVYHLPLSRLCRPDSFVHTTLRRSQLRPNLDRLGRVGALWQLLARVAVANSMRLPAAVPNVFATFYDRNLLSFGTIEEWVEGRPWRLEMDDRVFDRIAPPEPPDYLVPDTFKDEYTAKRFFLARFHRLLTEMGATGLAARYAWRNFQSTRRVELRPDATDVYHGLVAKDFEPALGDIFVLRQYLNEHAGWFENVHVAVAELLQHLEDIARGSRPTVPAMPRANPAMARLLWHWSSSQRSGSVLVRISAWWRHFVHEARATARLSRHAGLRQAWLLQVVDDGVAESELSEEEANRIREQVTDPDVQLYLHCLFVHLCMLPITPVTVLLAGWAYALGRGLNLGEGIQFVLAWLAVFAVLPLSPGSLARGLYVLTVAVKRRQLRRLRVALLVSFWRYIGYIAFPLQMATTFPALSRYMAALWATRAVRFIPWYGAHGGRLEHAVYDLFFNIPLTLARQRRERQGMRS